MPALLATALPIAAVFLAFGSAKVLALAPMRARAAHLGFSTDSYRVIGALEIAGAAGVLLGLVVPPLVRSPQPGCCSCSRARSSRTCATATAATARPGLVAGLLVAAYLVTLLGGRHEPRPSFPSSSSAQAPPG